MATIVADRVRDTTSSTSSPYTVSGSAPAKYRTFSVVMAASDVTTVFFRHQTQNEWQVATVTYTGTNELTVNTVHASSNGGAAVTFTAGTIDVVLDVPAVKRVLTDLIQTLTNKTLTSPVLTTPQINDTSADHQYIFAVSELAADRTVTLPLLTGNDTFVFADFTQTLANKTLTGLLSVIDDASNTAVTQAGKLTHTTSGSPGAGIGVSLAFEAETASANLEIGAIIEAVTTDVTSTSEDFDLRFKTMTAGAAATEKMRIDSAGVVTIGGFAPFSATSILEAAGGTAPTSSIALGRFSADAGDADLRFHKSRHATIGSHTALVADDSVGSIHFLASDGTGFIPAALITAWVDGTPGTNDMPGRLTFFTTADGAASTTERMRITNFGCVLMGGGGAHPINAFNETVGFGVIGGPASGPYGQFDIVNFQNSAFGSGLTFSQSRGATVGTYTVVQNDDDLAYIAFAGADGTNFAQAATIVVSVDGTPGNDDMPGRIAFATSADGSASPTERMRIDSAGRIITGGAAAQTSVFATTPQLQFNAAASSFIGTLASWRNGTGATNLFFTHSRSDTIGGHTIVQSGDELGYISFAGSDGTDFAEGAYIFSQVDGTPGNNDMPGRLIFATTADGAQFATERMRIDSTGQIICTSNILLTGVESDQISWQIAASGQQYNLNLSAGGTWYLLDVTNSKFPFLINANSTAKIEVMADGIRYATGNTTPTALTTNGEFAFTPTSNTNMRISYRGSDGTTRVGNITLA
jgi:hypothetical protein